MPRSPQWSSQEDANLRTLILASTSLNQMRMTLGRRVEAIRSRAYVLGLSLATLEGKAHRSKHHRTEEAKERIRREHAMRKRRKLAKRHPSSIADLQRIARASSIPVMKLPPGTHYGWRPSWA